MFDVQYPSFLVVAFLLAPQAYGVTHAPGLMATYSDGQREVTVIVDTPHLALKGGESIHPQIAPAFSARWQGFIEIQLPGRYRFSVQGASLACRINQSKVLDRWIDLDAGLHAVELAFTRGPGVTQIQWVWASEYFTEEPVPAGRLCHDVSVANLSGQRLVEAGRELVLSLGCNNCHAGASDCGTARVGPDLSNIGSRTSATWLNAWLTDPNRFRGHTTMPRILSDEERVDVVAYLASLEPVSFPPMETEGSAHDLSKGRQHYWALGCAACHEQESLELGALGSKTSPEALAAFLLNPRAVSPDGTMPDMMLSRREAEQLAWYLLQVRDQALEKATPPGDPIRGRTLLAQRGCLACHTLDDGTPLANNVIAPSLADLQTDRGCLADRRAAGLPEYALNSDQRQALAAYIMSQRSSPDCFPAPIYAFHQRLGQLRCVACHTFQNQGPSVALSERAPNLSEAGAKLQMHWIHGVLEGEHRIRPWLRLRMPRFSETSVAGLPEGFAQALGVGHDSLHTALDLAESQAAAGLTMIGTDGNAGGLACVNCHDWGEYASLGEQGPQLRNAAQRVRYPWFRRWMLQPSRIQPGTAMPVFFEGLDSAQANAKIDSLWAALSQAEILALPTGLGAVAAVAGSEEMPIPRREAIVIRWYMPEASPASIAVGMPGGVSYCFDAVNCRLLYAWSGGFVDMTPTLAKPAPPARIVGEIFYQSTAHTLAAFDAEPETSFLGYRLIEGYPQFQYRVDGVEVNERVIPVDGEDGFTREFQLKHVPPERSFRIQTGSEVTITSTLGEIDDGVLALPSGRDVRFDVTVVRIKDSLFED